ncbi:MAG: hypothetical protein IJL80_00020, partial [Treponema sp.]|nr:hypothetical protein [Treponema sp.]
QPPELALGLFYNTDRSIPFFLQGNGIISKLLGLYNIGRVDFSFNDNSIMAAYHATAVNSYSSRSLSGFPIMLEDTPDFYLEAEAEGKPADNTAGSEAVFWCEGGRTVKSLDFSSLSVSRMLLNENCRVKASAQPCSGGGVVWIVDDKGTVFLLDRKLRAVRPFPVLTGCKPSARPAAIGKKLLIPAEGGILAIVDDYGNVSELEVPDDCNFKSSPAVAGNTAAVYSKGFEGKIFLIQDGEISNADSPMEVDGIAFGSPCLTEDDGKTVTAMITQAGDFHLFEDGSLRKGFPVSVPGVFHTNVVRADGSYFALSADAELFRIEDDGSFSKVQVPGLSDAKEAWLSSDGEIIYLSGNSNHIYAFTSSLEMMYGFPVAGRGQCVITDVNGDGKKDCVALSMDKKIYAWTIR